MADANQELFDAALRHQIAVRRYSESLLKRILKLLEQADKDLVKKLRARLGPVLNAPIPMGVKRLQELLKEIRSTRAAVIANIADLSHGEFLELAKLEADWERSIIGAAIPFEFSLASVPVERLRAVVLSRPFQGRFLREWFQTLQRSDQQKIQDALRMGVTNGETLDDIVRRVAGTRANRYTDGIASVNRRNAQAVMRTAINHVSNFARAEVWDRNQDIIFALRWTATLDGRTSAVCRARDGDLAMLGNNKAPEGARLLSPQSARPPAHVNCRSVMVAVLDPEGLIGERPFVRDTRTRRKREIDFRADAKAQAGDAWRGMSEAQRRRAIAAHRSQWADSNIGRLPAETTYEEWMRRQPAGFQDEVLGKAKAGLFRRKKLSLDHFVDRAGRELTLEELRIRFPTAFEGGGVL